MDIAPGDVEPQDSDPPSPMEPSNDEELAPQCEDEETTAGALEEELIDANQELATASENAAELNEANQDPTTTSADAAELNDVDQDLATAEGAAVEAEVEAEAEPEAVSLAADEETPPVSVRRKRGRPRKSQTQSVKQQPKKRDEEDVCFVCYDGGSLVCCDRRGCPKVYHAPCIHQDEDFFKTRGKWNCGWHICSSCEKAAQYMCYTCTYSLCRRCVNESGFVCIRRNKGFCETCYSSVMRIESNEHDDEEKVGTVSGQTNTVDCLFRTYWFYLKEKFSLTLEELEKGEKKLKESGAHARKGDSSSDELYNGNDEDEASSDSSSGRRKSRTSSRKKVRSRSRANVIDDTAFIQKVQDEDVFIPEENQWASKELLEFVAHMKGGDKSVLSQFDVQNLLLDYIKLNNLRDPRKKSQIICDPRLVSLFGKARVGHFEMLKLLESHFHIKEVQQVVAVEYQGADVDPDSGQMDTEAYFDGATKGISDRRRKGRKKVEEREPQTNIDDYAAIDVHNISLIYLRRNLMEDLLDDIDKFSENVIGSFVRIRISGAAKQDMYRLVQVVGTSKAADSYKTGKKTTDFTVEILNLDKKEIVTIDTLSNQDFTEEECRRLRQSIKCGLIGRLTVGDIQEKSRLLQAVRVNDSIENEKQRLIHLRDRASETGRRKELRECVEKLQLLSTAEERTRRLHEVPEIHADPKMNPDCESADEEESAEKNHDVYDRASSSFRKGRDLVSPGRGARRGPTFPPSSTRNARTGFARDKLDSFNGKNEPLWSNEQDALQTNSREAGRRPSNTSGSEARGWNDNLTETDPGLSQGVSPETTSSLISDISETEKIWNYKDPAGTIQGPFSMVQLRKWSTTGYFPDDLRIWRASENEEDTVLLYDALAGKFEKDLPQWEPPRSNFSQPSAVSAATESRANEQEDSWRQNSNLLSANSNTLSGAWTGTANVERPDASGWTSQPFIASTPRMEAVNPIEVPQHQLQNTPRPPIYGAPYGTPPYQSSGVQGIGIAGVLNPGQDHRGNWSTNNPRQLQPFGQGYGGQHSNWSSPAQQHSTNQWGNASYNSMSTPTQLPGSQVWPTAQGTINIAAPMNPAVQHMGPGWGMMNMPTSPTPSVRPVGPGWGMMNVPPLPNPVQPMGSGWATPPVAGFNNGGLQPGSTAIDQNRAAIMGNSPAVLRRNEASNPVVLDRPTHKERGFAQSRNSFFESDCPSPTPSNERQGFPAVAQFNELDSSKKWPGANERLGSEPASKLGTSISVEQSDPPGNMSPIRDPEPKLITPALNATESISDRRAEGWAPAGEKDPDPQHQSPKSSGQRWEQNQSLKPETTLQKTGPVVSVNVEGPQDMRSDLWSLPSPTPSTKPPTDSAIQHPQPSQSGWGTNNNTGTTWGISPNADGGTGSAKENLNGGWGTTVHGCENAAAWGAPPQANPNPSQGWGGMHGNTNTTASWGTGVQHNSGWGAGPGDTDGWGTEQTPNGDPYRGERGGDSGRGNYTRSDSDPRRDSRFSGDSRRDSRYGGDSRYDSRRGGEQERRDRGGRSSRSPPRGQGGRGQGICKFHESGHCKKGSRCNYLHL